MDSDLGRLFWSVDGDPFFEDPSYFTETSKVDVLEIYEGASSNPAKFLLDLCMFIDEDAVHSEQVSITSPLLQKVFRTFNISPHFASSLTLFRSPSRNVHYDDMRNLGGTEHFEDQKTSEYTRLSKLYLLQCRQMTSLVIDNDLVQDVVLRVIEENKWVCKNWPRPEKDSAEAMWKRSCETVDEKLRWQLANLKISGRYARFVEDRARIGIDECRAAINQNDAENNLRLAEESTKLANASTKDSRSLAKLQYLAIITLPLSLASSILGMGFFSTTSSPSGEAQLLVSPSW
ncbi:MAG: hypothetical protein LQ348_003160 [Seirophora lacunosa]|nr:MAG: hypothetical protein LQ348_003160 [Seirophora lacunosa]